MWILFGIALFAAGYVALIYSWPEIRVWTNGVTEEVKGVRVKAEQLEARFREVR